MQIVAIAEPREYFRKRTAEKFHLEPSQIFTDWKLIADKPKFADAVIITTPDRLHMEPAIAFANKGYHILLEKPMAVAENECIDIVRAVHNNKVLLAVGHVLRYTPYTQKIKQLVSSGEIGDLINIQHVEPVGYYHFAHSYVRGNSFSPFDFT